MQGKRPPSKPFLIVENEGPSPRTRVLEPPDTLPKGLPRRCWDQLAKIMVKRGIYDDDCSDLMEVYCIQRARFLEADAKVRELSREKGDKRLLLWYLKMSNESLDRLVKVTSQLGLSPVTRTKAKLANHKSSGQSFLSAKKAKAAASGE